MQLSHLEIHLSLLSDSPVQQYEKENILSKVESQRQRSNQVQSALQAFAARQSQQTEGRMVLSQDKQAENREAQLEARRNKLKVSRMRSSSCSKSLTQDCWPAHQWILLIHCKLKCKCHQFKHNYTSNKIMAYCSHAKNAYFVTAFYMTFHLKISKTVWN